MFQRLWAVDSWNWAVDMDHGRLVNRALARGAADIAMTTLPLGLMANVGAIARK